MDFWTALERLVASSAIVIDRPKGSAHPRYPAVIYPLDYGYLEGTTSGDKGGIDVWVGSDKNRAITGLIVTADLEKKDSEIKILLGCTEDEMQTILRFHSDGAQAAILLKPVQQSPGQPAE